MAKDKGRRPGGRPPVRPTPIIDLKATEVTDVTKSFAASEGDPPPATASAAAPSAEEAAAAFAASEADLQPADPEIPPTPAEEAATEFAASEADRTPDAFEGLAPPEGSAPPPADEAASPQPTDCWPAVPDEEADVSKAADERPAPQAEPAPQPEPQRQAEPQPAAASAIPGRTRRSAPEPEAPSVDPQVFDRPRRGMGRDELREPRRGRGGLLPGLLGGAVAGGLVAAGLVASGLLPQRPDATDERRITGIEASIRSLVESRAQTPAADPQLVQRLAAAEAAIKAFGESPVEASVAAPDPALAERVAAAEAAARQAGEQAASIGAEVRRLAEQQSATPAPQPPPADTARLDALGTDIAALKAEIGRIAETARTAPADNAERLTALQQSQTVLDQRLAEADRRLAEVARQTQEASAASQQVGQRTEAIDRRLAEMTQQAQALGAASQQLGQRTEAIDRRLAEAEQARTSLGQEIAAVAAREKVPDADQPARLLLVVDALDRAVAAGRPYRAEIDAVKALAPDPQALGPLEATATSGLPTVPTLAARAKAELAKLAPLGGAAAEPSPGGLIDRLAAGARSLVKVTPDGAAAPAAEAGDPRQEFVARLEAGDLAGAGAAFARMDQAGQQAVADIALAAAARRAAVGLLAGLRSGAIAAFGNRS